MPRGSAPGERRGGRKRGTPNKSTQDLIEMIEATGCVHPVQGMAEIAVIARSDGNLDLAQTCYKELAQYVASKKKAVEHTGSVETNQPLVIVLDEFES